jgi:hypothetical protein
LAQPKQVFLELNRRDTTVAPLPFNPRSGVVLNLAFARLRLVRAGTLLDRRRTREVVLLLNGRNTSLRPCVGREEH